MEIQELEEGQKILFNDRKKPLEVKSRQGAEAKVKGPNGGEYILYMDGNTKLFSKKGKKKYSSYLEDLRTVGQWKETSDGWKHSKTGEVIKVVKKGPTWEIKSERLEVDQPRYGYTEKEEAVEKAEKIIEKYPEGRSDEGR